MRGINRAGWNAHASGKRNPVKIGIAEAQHLLSALARRFNAYALKFALQDSISAVGQNNGAHLKLLASLSPESLQGVHRAAVSLQTNHLPDGARDGSAGRERRTDANRPARNLQIVMGLGSAGQLQ